MKTWTFRFAASAVSAIALAGLSQAQDADAALAAVLAADIRDDDRARDQYRNPAETLAFFGVTADMAVGEYSPGGGWYTRVLAPYVAETGQYAAVGADVERYLAGADADRIARAKAWPDNFPARAAESTGVDAAKISAFELDEAPEGFEESLDAFLVFRSMHSLFNREVADSFARDAYALLKPGGVLGVVQHRAKVDAPYAYTSGANGYLKEAEVIALFESQGFVLEATSEINSNAKDPANWEGGVWTLPPVLRYEEKNRDEYLAIGESDRMTLRFRKPAPMPDWSLDEAGSGS